MKKIAITIITFISIAYGANNKPYITKLTLSLPKKEINKDSTIEAKVTVTYSNNTTKELSKNIEWIVSKKDALKIKNTKLTAIKDYPNPVTIEVKVKNSLNKIVTSNKESLKIYWEVNGHRLPPEPDPKVNNSTLLGVDVNKNGVRDDVERKVYAHYKKAIERAVMMQAFKTAQAMLADPELVKHAREWAVKEDKVIDCNRYLHLYKKQKRIKIFDSVHKWQFNNKERWTEIAKKGMKQLHHDAINGFTGDYGVMPPRGTCTDCSDQDLYDAIGYMLKEAGVSAQ